jgi:rhamnose transport system permease protein
MRARTNGPGLRRQVRAFAARFPEVVTLLVLVLAFGISASLSPYFLDARFLFDETSLYMEIGIIALAMALVIISGNIDLSVASGLALLGALSAILHIQWGLPMLLVIPLILGLGGCLGLFNGLLVTRLKLPSLTVTLGTLALYRGIAQILMGDHSVSGFPSWFTGVDYVRVGGLIPLPLVLFAVLAVAFGLLLHKTVFGRYVFAIGTNEAAARYSGIPVDRVKLLVFVLSGLTMAIGALLMVSRLTVARYDHALGNELAVITAVVLGGVHIFGGRGRIAGVVLALFALGFLRTGMGVANISSEAQLVVIGSLLLFAVALGNWIHKSR